MESTQNEKTLVKLSRTASSPSKLAYLAQPPSKRVEQLQLLIRIRKVTIHHLKSTTSSRTLKTQGKLRNRSSNLQIRKTLVFSKITRCIKSKRKAHFP